MWQAIQGTKIRNLFFGLAALALFGACSSEIIDNDSPPEKQYEEGLRLMKKEHFIEAVERFRALKSHYPYSKYAALAALKIGDAHFEEEAYIEAASAYKVFRELYPKHEMASYALYRMGESQYKLVPDSPDRDLDSAFASIEAFKQLIKDYPNTPYLDEAKKKLVEMRVKLADKEDYVGNFYFIRELYTSAAGRYRYLLDQYPESPYTELALYRLAFSYEKIGEYTKALEAIERLETEVPNSKFKKEATVLKSELEKEQDK